MPTPTAPLRQGPATDAAGPTVTTRTIKPRRTRPAPVAPPTPAAPNASADAPDAPPTQAPIAIAGRRIHFVGIGGCGMSGLARMVQARGAICCGSDQADSDIIDALRAARIPVSLEQSAAAVPDACDLVVISAAIKPDHPELVEARRRGLRILKYSQMLGALMIGRIGVAVAGTHGKSTTTSLLSHILIQCGLDPSFIVGAHCEQIGGGSRCGQSELLVAEACEYDRSFHNLHPTHAIVLNVEVDHLDMYSGIDEIVEAFTVFARKLPAAGDGGTLLINHDMTHRLPITGGLRCAVETIGFTNEADWHVEVRSQESGGRGQESGGRNQATGELTRAFVSLRYKGEDVCEWVNPLPGNHMAYNAAAAAITAHRLGAAWNDIAVAVAGFQGLNRRMQLLGTRIVTAPRGRGTAIPVIDDYGHHPTEVDATLRALRRHYNPKRVICVFQPHQHSRTRFLLNEFAASFAEADLVVVPQIYFVRDSEKEMHEVSSADLVDQLRRRGKHAIHLYPFEAIVEHVELIAQPGDLVVTMGAGDVWKVARGFLNGAIPNPLPLREPVAAQAAG